MLYFWSRFFTIFVGFVCIAMLFLGVNNIILFILSFAFLGLVMHTESNNTKLKFKTTSIGVSYIFVSWNILQQLVTNRSFKFPTIILYIIIILGLWIRDAIDIEKINEILQKSYEIIDANENNTEKDYQKPFINVAKFVTLEIIKPTRSIFFILVIVFTFILAF